MKTALATALALWTALALALAAPPQPPDDEQFFPLEQMQADGNQWDDAPFDFLEVPQVRNVAEDPEEGRILNGQLATACQFPYQVGMKNGNNFCGGSLISKRWVLTAAHCVVGATTLPVFLGSVDWTKPKKTVYSPQVYHHHEYNSSNLNNDIALVDLGEDIREDACIKPVKLASRGCGDSTHDNLDVINSGWGQTSNSQKFVGTNLRWVKARTTSNSKCAPDYLNGLVVRSTICVVPSDAKARGTFCSAPPQPPDGEQFFPLEQMQSDGNLWDDAPFVFPEVPQMCDVEEDPEEGRILNGQLATACQFPYQVGLLKQNVISCGGSLISKRWVLTAAHCLTGVKPPVPVVLGSLDWTKPKKKVNAPRFFIHQNYNSTAFNNDIALVDLRVDIPEEACVKPVKLASQGCWGNNQDNPLNVIVSGWGFTSDGHQMVEKKLGWAKARTIKNTECAPLYLNGSVLRTNICTRPREPNAKGTICTGDSGGPMVDESTGLQIGVNSFTVFKTCETGLPNVYLRVACYVDWIKNTMRL